MSATKPLTDARWVSLKLGHVFRLGAVVLLTSIILAYFSGLAAIRAARSVSREESVIFQLQEMFSTLKDAETGQRGFILTGEDNYAIPYAAARAQLASQLSDLTDLSASDPAVAQDVSQLHKLVDAKVAELELTINIRRSQGLDAAVNVVKTNRGKNVMDEVRQLVNQIVVRENAQLKQDRHHSDLLNLFRTVMFVLIAVANLAFLYWAYNRIKAEIARTHEAAEKARQQEELLRVTLASIGDGVIVTDVGGTITFLNPIAATLTGWSPAEAAGLCCARVFNIINESTRKLVESPVDKVLRLGTVVGLANHTLLIRRDNSEIPIDDSGAPIRDSDGKLRGTVLVFRDFTDHKKNESVLRQAKEEAEAANIAKDNFLATLSHELRTPLTPVAAILSSWEVSEKIPPALLPDIQMMRRNVDLEARLIDDLLDLTRIVRGKLSLNFEVADVHELIASVAAMYKSEAQSKHLRLTLALEAQKHFVYADPARLQQVVLNLLKNALKFTPEGGAVDLRTGNNDDGAVIVRVHDTGIGMAPPTLEKLFHPFEQGTDEVVKRYGGLGLGLAISKTLMDAQNGTISAASEGLGKGSTFALSLPCVNAPDCAPVPTQPPRARSNPVSILFVEDHADTARVMSNLLTSFGHTVAVASTVDSALNAFNSQPFELIISDIGLPDGTGIDLIKKIRETSNIPAVALTGFGMEDDVGECLAAGFNAHLTKPVNLQKLELMIQQLSQAR